MIAKKHRTVESLRVGQEVECLLFKGEKGKVVDFSSKIYEETHPINRREEKVMILSGPSSTRPGMKRIVGIETRALYFEGETLRYDYQKFGQDCWTEKWSIN